MNNHQQQELVDHQERFKKLENFLKRTGFTGNVPFSLNFSSLPSDEMEKFINEAKAVFAYAFNLPLNHMLELYQLLGVEIDTSDDDDDENIQVLGG
jgi:hypothetical protein